jgi:hypothetical protein
MWLNKIEKLLQDILVELKRVPIPPVQVAKIEPIVVDIEKQHIDKTENNLTLMAKDIIDRKRSTEDRYNRTVRGSKEDLKLRGQLDILEWIIVGTQKGE